MPPACDAIFSLGPLDAFAQWLAASGMATQPRIVAIGSLSERTKRRSRDPAERALAERLATAEYTLATAAEARGSTATILRASLVWGAGLDRSLTPIAALAQRWHVFPLAPGARGLRQPVHADDLAGACSALAELPATGGTYDVGGGERLPFAAMLARVRASLPFATLPLPIPIALARAGHRPCAATARVRCCEHVGARPARRRPRRRPRGGDCRLRLEPARLRSRRERLDAAATALNHARCEGDVVRRIIHRARLIFRGGAALPALDPCA